MVKNISRNVGIDLLRVWMCFGVILVHFWNPETTSNDILRFILIQTQQLAVPVFMTISFVVVSKKDIGFSFTNEKLIKRLKRLIVPILFWCLVYYLVFFFAQIFTGKDYQLSVPSFLSQLIIGHVYNKPMWFMNALVYFTLLFFFIYRCKKHYQYIFLVIMAIISFLMEYLGLNHIWFDFMPESIGIPLGRFINMLPFACTGILLIQTDIISRIKSYKLALAGLILIFMLICLAIPTWDGDLYGSCGFRLFFMSVILVIIFYNITLDKCPNIILKVISILSKYTLGIYCIHNMIGGIYNQMIASRFELQTNTFLESCVIFAVSLLLSIIIYLVPIKIIKKTVS